MTINNKMEDIGNSSAKATSKAIINLNQKLGPD